MFSQPLLVDYRETTISHEPVGRKRHYIQFKRHLFGTSDCALPNDKAAPACIQLKSKRPCIPKLVALYLLLPEGRIGFWSFTVTAAMPVPEAAVHMDQRVIFRQHDVRLTRNIFCVKPETEAKSVQPLAKKHFRARILRPNAGHHPAASSFVDYVQNLVITSSSFVSQRKFGRQNISFQRRFHHAGNVPNNIHYNGITELFVGAGIRYRNPV